MCVFIWNDALFFDHIICDASRERRLTKTFAKKKSHKVETIELSDGCGGGGNGNAQRGKWILFAKKNVLYQIYEIHFRWQILVLLHHTVTGAVCVAVSCFEWRCANEKAKKMIGFVLIPLCESDVWMGQWTSQRKKFSVTFFFFILMNCLQKFKDEQKKISDDERTRNNLIWFDTFVKPHPKIKRGTFAGRACKIRQCDR